MGVDIKVIRPGCGVALMTFTNRALSNLSIFSLYIVRVNQNGRAIQ